MNNRVNKNTRQPKTAPDWWEKEIKGKRGLLLCSNCRAVYYDKHWHTNKKYASILKKQEGVKQEMCPECRFIGDLPKGGKMEKEVKRGNINFEGEVTLKNIPLSEKKIEILNLVRNVGKRAVKRDPEDRIIKIEDKGKTIRILTSENQLAVSIGKQVERAFKGGDLKIKWSEKDALARVIWTNK